jgi:hypothetical protein
MKLLRREQIGVVEMDSFEKAFNDNTLEIIKKLSYEFFVDNKILK